MTDLMLLPYAEKIINTYLAAADPVIALDLDGLWTRKVSDGRCTRLTRVGGSPLTSWPLYADVARCQLDSWAAKDTDASDDEARLIAATCTAVLGLPEFIGTHADGTVSDIEFGPSFPLPDTTSVDQLGRARARWITQFSITSHP